MAATILIPRFEQYAQEFHRRYDPSHDYEHVRRVTLTALAIANSLQQQSEESQVDTLVVHLAALAHDLLDSKYLPKDSVVPSAVEYLDAQGLWRDVEDFSEDRRRLVGKIVDNVSFSKEKKRIAAGQMTTWHAECLELHCVQDADKLDAIGAFGVMRCMAYSGAANRPLHHSDGTNNGTGGDSAIDHFYDKLFKLEGLMRTARGREMAKQRTEFMRAFVDQVQREHEEVVQGS